jgi:DNA primase large subunit
MASAKFKKIIENGRLDLPPLTGRLTEAIDRIRARLPKRREFTRVGKVAQTAFPPCMDSLYSRLQSGQNLAHMERFTLAAFLNKINLDRAEIKRVFRQAPDAGLRGGSIVDYQVDHIADKGSRGLDDDSGYMPISCKKMMNPHGICPVYKGEVFDPLCKYVKNPLTFYNRRSYELSKGYQPNPDFYAKKYEVQNDF